MRNSRRKAFGNDDADVAAGGSIPAAPTSISTVTSSASDIEFFEDLVSEPVLVLGFDITHLSGTGQFIVCATGVFFFTLLYGYLQELLSVQLCSRHLGLFLATAQFLGYTILSFILREFVYKTHRRSKLTPKKSNTSYSFRSNFPVPMKLYLGLSLLRALDLGMTNLAMQYINYPAKTMLKSSRVVFTMIFGVLITKKAYNCIDYFVVLYMVAGLAIFMHADANSSAVFQPRGVVMLIVSLLCDGAISNMSENIMRKYGVGQDEFIFRMYSIALVAITAASIIHGDMRDGIIFMTQPGTYAEQQHNVPLDERSWSAASKVSVLILFSSMGFFGSSCSAAITKNFGALTMSITSTARKATTLFLSFLLFDNKCTFEHLVGIFVFISALITKSLRRKGKKRKSGVDDKVSVELGSGDIPIPSRVSATKSDNSDRSHLSRRERRRARNQRDGVRNSKSPSTNRYHVV